MIMAAVLAFSIFTYTMGMRALRKLPIGGAAAIIGSDGIVVTPLEPSGYVKIHGELWKASSNAHLEAGDPVTVTAINGLTLTVIPRIVKVP